MRVYYCYCFFFSSFKRYYIFIPSSPGTCRLYCASRFHRTCCSGPVDVARTHARSVTVWLIILYTIIPLIVFFFFFRFEIFATCLKSYHSKRGRLHAIANTRLIIVNGDFSAHVDFQWTAYDAF